MEEMKKLVKEFIGILEMEEESDSGTIFKPVSISSCRAMLSKRIDEILSRLDELVNSES